MPRSRFLLPLALLLCAGVAHAQDPPVDWVDPATGHRVLRLSRDGGTASFYFHQYPYTQAGDKIVVSTRGGLATIDLTTLGVKPGKIEQIVQGGARSPIVGRKSRQVFYAQGGSIYATHLDTKATRKIVDLPAGLSAASGLALNADETLLASTGNDPQARALAKDKADPRAGKERSMVLFTINVKTGAIQRIHHSVNWLNHTQFSPTDPQRILFCHEGKWDYVDRVWTIRADGTDLRKMHTRTMDREIFGHEFFSQDGKWVWYDLQTPRSTKFAFAGVNLETGERIRYQLARAEWSVHYNQAPDGKLFAGDGGGPNSVANRTLKGPPLDKQGNGQWIYFFRPESSFETIKVGNEDVKLGRFQAEKLVDMSRHNYKLEPNVTFTPDNRWIVFRSNMHGPTHVYAVEVKKAEKRLPTLFVIGDSTVRNNTKGQQGWGDSLAALFDQTRNKVENRALGGRSSRTFLREGLWAKIVAQMQPGDFVLMQFGHNDGGPLNSGRARASLKGNGEETQEIIDEKTAQKEVVHTYGWYLRKYCADATAKGATPIVLSPIPRNIWKDGKVARASRDYGKWSAESAHLAGAAFVDLNELVAVRYEKLGPEKVSALFFGDHTHTSAAGARINAEAVVEGLQGLKDCPLCRYLK